MCRWHEHLPVSFDRHLPSLLQSTSPFHSLRSLPIPSPCDPRRIVSVCDCMSDSVNVLVCVSRYVSRYLRAFACAHASALECLRVGGGVCGVVLGVYSLTRHQLSIYLVSLCPSLLRHQAGMESSSGSCAVTPTGTHDDGPQLVSRRGLMAVTFCDMGLV